MIKRICAAFVLLLLSFVVVVYADGVTHIDQQELAEKMKSSDAVLIDIRTIEEVNQGYIPGAVHIPIDKIKEDSSLLDDYLGKDIIFYCHSGVRVNRLTNFLQDENHKSEENLFHLKGDYSAWVENGNDIEK